MVVHQRGGAVGSRVRRKDLTLFASLVPHCAETSNLCVCVGVSEERVQIYVFEVDYRIGR